MKTLLKVLGWIFIYISVVGGPKLIISHNFHWPTFLVVGVFIVLAWLCFWGAKRLKKKEKIENS